MRFDAKREQSPKPTEMKTNDQRTLKEQFRIEHPETIGEKDRSFDDANYIDWLETNVLIFKASVENLEKLLQEKNSKSESGRSRLTQPMSKEKIEDIMWEYAEPRIKGDEVEADADHMLHNNNFDKAAEKISQLSIASPDAQKEIEWMDSDKTN